VVLAYGRQRLGQLGCGMVIRRPCQSSQTMSSTFPANVNPATPRPYPASSTAPAPSTTEPSPAIAPIRPSVTG
jgi:hypothetical protein